MMARKRPPVIQISNARGVIAVYNGDNADAGLRAYYDEALKLYGYESPTIKNGKMTVVTKGGRKTYTAEVCS